MWQFGKGYVIIQIEGLSAAAFLRRLTEAGVRVARVQSFGPGTVRCTIAARRFFALHGMRKGLSIRIRIVARGGLPFQLQKLKKRPVLWIGTAALFCVMCALSARVWSIRVEGAVRVDPEEVLALLSEHGIRPGAVLKGPILITAANDLSARIRDAAWIGLDREGVMLRVSVVEALPASPKRTDRVPSDIVAEKDGVVTAVNVMRGQARVSVGDSVKAGDVLISGTIERSGETVLTAADGSVTAAVTYSAEAPLKESVTEAYETDACATVRALYAARWEILRSKPDFEQYRLTEVRSVAIGTLLPLSVETAIAREIAFRERALSEEEAEQYALIEAREQAYAAVPFDAAILNTYGTVVSRGGRRVAVVTVTAEEIIGRTEEAPYDG